MGLSGRKVKQRISADPRNLTWADDAARFGTNYLSKFGWDASKGLGAGGDGMKSHIKVSHKLDMLGIGAAQTKDPNGIPWKQNTDFENLLRRLNENLSAEDTAPAEDKDANQDEVSGDKSDADAGEKKKKKRKHKDTEDDDRTERKKKKKELKEGFEQGVVQTSEVVETESVVVEVKKVVTLPRHRAHRARAIAAKNIASKSSAHISEILGVAPDSQTATTTQSVQGKLTSVTETDALGMDKLTTSAKSLADYFKEKLIARNGSDGSGANTPASTSTSNADEDAYERPRTGIGASRMRLEIQTETKIEEETQRVGLSKFSALMSSSFLAATSSMTVATTENKDVTDEVTARISDVESDAESKKKHKKDKKKDKKEGKVDEAEGSEKKKSKKDKKGKGKVADEVDELESGSGDESSNKKSTADTDTTEDHIEKSSRKKEKRKHKTDESSLGSEEAIKSKKEKKKHRTDS